MPLKDDERIAAGVVLQDMVEETGWTRQWPAIAGHYWRRINERDPASLVRIIGDVCRFTDGSEEGRHECYEFLGPVTVSDAEQLMELRRALLSIERAAPACECEHNNEYCCAVVGEFCAMCWAHAALNPDLPKETQ